ncbi:MAG: HD domain-containing protein [Candidatus Heimdallarchaeaceae archaeon]
MSDSTDQKNTETEELYNMVLGFIQSAIKLKSLPRQGWIRVGIPLSVVESVADHCYNTAMLSLLLVDLHNALYPEENLSSELVMRIAIVHDLPECMYQDFDKQVELLIGKDHYLEFKTTVLTNASNELLSLILNENVREKWKQVLNDIAVKSSIESKFVNYIDKLEILVQALSYEMHGYNAKMFASFWNSSLEFLENCPFDVINDLIPILIREREKIND